MKILIGAHYNLNNGDRALLEATLQLLQIKFPQSETTVSAYEPTLLQDERFNTVAWPLKSGKYENIMLKLSCFSLFRRLYRKLYTLISDSNYIKAVKAADIVLISGGHHLTDILGSESYYRLASNFIAPISLNKKLVLLPQSIGPADNLNIKKSIKDILSKASSVAYRDESSGNFLKYLNCKTNIQYVPDLVYCLEMSRSKNNSNPKTIGVALYHSYSEKREEKILPFTLNNLEKTLDEMIGRGYKIKILPMDSGDEQVAQEIYDKLKSPSKSECFLVGSQSNNILDIINQFRDLAFVLAYKTHSTIFSMICNTPLISIAYHPKSIEFMDSVGLKEYSITDTEASSNKLISLINSLEKNFEVVREKEIVGIEKNRKMINKYIQEVLENEIN